MCRLALSSPFVMILSALIVLITVVLAVVAADTNTHGRLAEAKSS